MYLQPATNRVHLGTKLVPALAAVFSHVDQSRSHRATKQTQQNAAPLIQAV